MYKLIDHCKNDGWWIMLYNATFNNISVILWLSFLLAEEETGVPRADFGYPVYTLWFYCSQ
jgi:hypothetical protein